jgi:uncharacterized membrane protein
MGRRFFLAVGICAAIGASVSGLALRHHYRPNALSFCNINAAFDCDVVNRSSYSTVAGIPVALAGLLAYLLILGLATFQAHKPETPALLLCFGATGWLFSVYLTYVEAIVLRTWCVLCLTSLVSMTFIALLATVRVRAELRSKRRDPLVR